MKKRNVVILTTLLIVALISLGILFGSSIGLSQSLFQLTTGGIVISAVQADFISNDPTIGGKSWLVTMTLTGQGQSLVGTVSKDQIKDPVTGEQAEYDLGISASVDDQVCDYAISGTDERIYTLNYESKNFFLGIGSDVWQNECLAKGLSMFGKKAWTYDYYCVWLTPEAYYGTLRTPTTVFDATVSLTSHGETKSKTISSIKQADAWLDNIAYVSWGGNLVSGESCPEALSQNIAAAYYQGSWRTIDKTTYDSYKSDWSWSSLTGNVNMYLEKGWDIKSLVNDYNSDRDEVLTRKPFYFYAYDGSVLATGSEQPGTSTSGKVLMSVPKLLQFPQLVFRIDADWIGIKVPVGVPEIVSITSKPFETGYTGYATVTIKNVGDADGSFAVYADCPEPFSQVGTTEFITLKPGTTGTVNLRVSATCESDISKSCTITVYDRNNPNNKDTGTVGVGCKPKVVCSPGEARCNGNLIEKCNPAGSCWGDGVTCGTYVEKCDVSCELKNGVPTCVEEARVKWCEKEKKDVPAGEWTRERCEVAPPGIELGAIALLIGGLAVYIFSIFMGVRRG